MSSLTIIAAIVIVSSAVVTLGLHLIEPTRDCRACDGVGVRRGARGRWSGFCPRCNGSGQRDAVLTRVLVVVTRGRVLPRAGSAVDGPQHGQGYRFDGRSPGGRWRAAPDPVDSRMQALVGRRVPAAERAVERAQDRAQGARGPAWIVAVLRLALARRRLRKAVRAVELHAEALAEHDAGYRRMAGRGRRHRR